MRFEYPLVLWLTPLLVLAVLGLVRWGHQRRLALAARWSAEAAALAARGRRGSLALLGVVAALAAVAMAGPRGALGTRTETGAGLNVLVAVDISRSMLAEDEPPTRLQSAVDGAIRVVQDLSADRVGVMAFAGQAYVLSPLTLDHGAALLYLRTLDPDVATAGGTQLAVLFGQATRVLEQTVEGGDRVLVLFTDGEAHDDLRDITASARALGAAGIRLLVVPVGGTEPVRIPRRDLGGPTLAYHRTAEGEEVRTARRDDVLVAIANAAEGRLLPAGEGDQASTIRAELAQLERRPLTERRLADLVPLAWVPALLAGVALLIHSITRRGASLIALAMLLLGQPAGAQRTVAPGDTTQYNRGTAALAAGDLAAARQLLRPATTALDPELRTRAWYNLGLAALRQAREEPAARDALEAEATEAFRQVLLLAPSSGAAKWNLELLRRPRPPSSPAAGPPPPRPATGGPGASPPTQGLTVAEADALLQAASDTELRARTNALRKQRVLTRATRKDW